MPSTALSCQSHGFWLIRPAKLVVHYFLHERRTIYAKARLTSMRNVILFQYNSAGKHLGTLLYSRLIILLWEVKGSMTILRLRPIYAIGCRHDRCRSTRTKNHSCLFDGKNVFRTQENMWKNDLNVFLSQSNKKNLNNVSFIFVSSSYVLFLT